jgi:NAD(P)-dependent dehydrogenase (short-subunit alcohol dehydrogenase family)
MAGNAGHAFFSQGVAMSKLEVAGSFVFLASDEARYMTGHVLHPGSGTSVAG